MTGPGWAIASATLPRGRRGPPRPLRPRPPPPPRLAAAAALGLRPPPRPPRPPLRPLRPPPLAGAPAGAWSMPREMREYGYASRTSWETHGANWNSWTLLWPSQKCQKGTPADSPGHRSDGALGRPSDIIMMTDLDVGDDRTCEAFRCSVACESCGLKLSIAYGT